MNDGIDNCDVQSDQNDLGEHKRLNVCGDATAEAAATE
jgi:hypothetical protein